MVDYDCKHSRKTASDQTKKKKGEQYKFILKETNKSKRETSHKENKDKRKEYKKEEKDKKADYDYVDSNDEETHHKLRNLKKKYKVKFFLIYLNYQLLIHL